MKLSNIKIDAAKVEQGVWIDQIPGMDDVRLLVRGNDNGDQRRLRSKLIAALSPGAAADPAQIDRIGVKLMVETTLLDWSGVEGDDGQPLPFSREKAFEIMSDPDYKALYTAALWASAQVERVSREQMGIDAKN